MPTVSVTPVNVAEQLTKLKAFRLKNFRRIIHLTMFDFMQKVKFESPNAMLKGPRGVSLSQSYRQRPSTPGKLTSRTYRLERMLREEVATGVKWKGLGTKNATTVDTISKSFFGRVKQVGENFEGTWSIYIRDGSIGLANYTGKKSVEEMKQSLYWRAQHENGVKGNAPRPYLAPTARKYMKDVVPEMHRQLQKNRNLWEV